MQQGDEGRDKNVGSPRPTVLQRPIWTVVVGLIAIALAALVVPAPTSIPVASNTALIVVSCIFLLLVLAVVLTVSALALIRARRTTGRVVVAGVAVLALTASGVIGSSIVVFAHEHGVSPTLAAFQPLPLGDSSPDSEVDRYTTFDGKDLGLSVWEPANLERRSAPAPIIVGVHGGGWTAGDRHSLDPFMRQFADRGFLAVSLSYSLSDATHQNWNLQESQIACGLTWFADNAARLGGDIDRLMLMGFSAGGNLAFNVASKSAGGSLESSCDGEIPEVSTLSINVGAADVAAVWNESDPLNRDSLHEQLTEHLGGSPDEFPERYAAMSSLEALTPRTPATVWLYGANDHTVPTGSSERMMRAIRSAGVPLEELRVPFGDHSAVGGLATQAWIDRSIEFMNFHR